MKSTIVTTVPTLAERRLHERHAIRTDAAVLLPDGYQYTVQTLDLGRAGMALVADINPPVGSNLAVRVSLPLHPSGHGLFVAHARVANSVLDGAEGGFRVSLQFLTLEAAATQVLERFLP
ncbi:MAG: PilZ domain-containing protein [Leptothrix sp. (in: b-proteobacteria)]